MVGRYGRWVVGVVMLGALAVERDAFAQEVQRLEPVVVTATRIEEPLERIGASVSVITEEEIEARQYRSVAEALRTVPGLDVQQSGSPGRLTTVRIRGAGAGQIQVLIDGVRVKSTTSGDFDFADLTTDDVERIEVVRGPQSTLYGADAIGGVINIITKKGRGRPSGFAQVEAGNFDTFRERAGVSGAVGPWDFSLGVSRLDFGGQFRNDEHSNTTVNGRVGLALPNRGQLSLIGRFTDAHRGIPFRTVFPDFDRNREQDDTLFLLSGQWRQPWTAWYEHQLTLSTFGSELIFRDPPDPGEAGPGIESEIDIRRREVDWLHHVHLGKLDTVTLGLELREEEGTIREAFSKSITTRAAWLQNELRLFDRFFLTAGVRHDDNSAFGEETTFRAAVSYLLKATGTRLKGSFAEGFRAPTLNDLFFPGFGNPDLRPEQSESWDAGFEQRFWQNRIRLGATYFRNTFKDLIQVVLVDPETFLFAPVNVARARTQGVEVEGSIEPVDRLLLQVAYTHTDTEDLATGKPLRRFAPNKWSLSGSYEPLTGLVLTAQAFIVSSQFESQALGRNPGYTRVDAGLTYRLPWRRWPLRDLELSAKVQNLFDEEFEEVKGFPALGTHYVFGLRGTF